MRKSKGAKKSLALVTAMAWLLVWPGFSPLAPALRSGLEPDRDFTQAAESLREHISMLHDPREAWGGRRDPANSLDFEPLPELFPEKSGIRRELSMMLSALAPRIWQHPDETDEIVDPLAFLQNSSLWERTPWGADRVLAKKGTVRPERLGQHFASDFSSQTLPGTRFLRYEGPAGPRANTLRDPAANPAPQAPAFWKLGWVLPWSRTLRLSTTREVVLIEYWYHLNYSRSGELAGIGDHQGDWEGMAWLIELQKPSARAPLRHRPLAAYFAAHEGGGWRCADDVLRTRGDAHPEAFSALGSHATFARPGTFRTWYHTDHAARGRPFDAWKNLRPMAAEPYYGFTGLWGARHFLAFMSGPLPPSTRLKTLPKLHQLNRIPAPVVSGCRLPLPST